MTFSLLQFKWITLWSIHPWEQIIYMNCTNSTKISSFLPINFCIFVEVCYTFLVTFSGLNDTNHSILPSKLCFPDHWLFLFLSSGQFLIDQLLLEISLLFCCHNKPNKVTVGPGSKLCWWKREVWCSFRLVEAHRKDDTGLVPQIHFFKDGV